ncbi:MULTISPECIES: ImmA/IrrE family metallo-endopeptidase [unclassified Microbacterium]|uniref:ImmA/IrrE family metallo-endopeptidase n=1 Tax=unclassified Microbacterium TaxID=2609290 RepID=UPI00386CE148
MRQLIARAAQQGLRVHGAHLDDDKIGAYAPGLRRIYFDLSLSYAERRSVIAHELGHHHYGHLCDSTGNEDQADAYAAALLIEPEWYAELERINHDAEWIAEEMNVAPWVILDFRRYWLRRYGNVTYSRPRLGANQWDHRAVV